MRTARSPDAVLALEAIEEVDWSIQQTGDALASIVESYFPMHLTDSVKIEQCFNHLRKSERMLSQRWSSSEAQLTASQVHAIKKRYSSKFKVQRFLDLSELFLVW
jgi:hypothetical protein